MTARRSIGLAIVPVCFIAVFFFYPVINLIGRGLTDDGGRIADVLTGARFLRIIWFTIWQAALSTAATVVIAWPLTWAVANRRFTGRSLVRVLTTIPFVLPTVVVASAFLAISDRRSVWAIIAAHVFFNVAVIVRSVGGMWSQLDRRPEDAARSLGASPWVAFRVVTLPRLRLALLASAAIVFLFSFTSFAVVLILGGLGRSTLDTEIFRWAVTRGDIATAAALSVVQLVAVAALLLLNARLGGRSSQQSFVTDRAVTALGPRQQMATFVAIAVPGAFLATPIAMLVLRSFSAGGGLSLANYQALRERPRVLQVSPLDTLVNSLSFAVAAAGIAAIVGGLAALTIVHGPRGLRRVLDLGMLLPLGTSAVTLGFGFLISLDRGVLDLRSSWWIVPIAQALIGIPFVVRAVIPVLRAIDGRLREAAASLGASPSRVWREIDLRIGGRALATGLGFAFAVSMGEFGATSFVGRQGDLTTMPLAIARLLSTPGTQLRGQAMALSVILMLVTSLVVLIGDRLHPDGGGVL